jgi:hypothetical protein
MYLSTSINPSPGKLYGEIILSDTEIHVHVPHSGQDLRGILSPCLFKRKQKQSGTLFDRADNRFPVRPSSIIDGWIDDELISTSVVNFPPRSLSHD